MIAEIKHYLREWRNLFLFVISLVISSILFILVLISIDSTILLNTFLFIVECSVMLNINLTILPNIYVNFIVLLIIVLIIILIELSFILVLDGFFSIMGKWCINKISMCKNEVSHIGDGDEYSAVLIGNNLSKDKNFFTNAGACGLYLLYRYFKNTNKKYEIREKVGKSDFDEFVLNDDCQELYILGHGSKNSFKMKNGTNDIDYLEYKGKTKHKKRVVAQLHCASSKIGDESLVDILEADKNNSYVGHGYIFSLNIWCYCFKMWKNNRPKK